MQRSLYRSVQAAVPGIIGGLGPLAHIEFERRLIDLSVQRGAVCDQDHPSWILINATAMPDRTQSLQGKTADCAPWLIRYGKLLRAAGADFLVVTCNTAHAFYRPVQEQLDVPWLHLMAGTTQFIVEHYPHMRRVGILATDGTLQSRLYTRSLLGAGLTPLAPDLGSAIQRQVMQAIYAPKWGVKSSGGGVSMRATNAIEEAIAWLHQQGAELIIAGCTELSVAIAQMHSTVIPWVDPLTIMANLTLDLASGQRQLKPIRAA